QPACARIFQAASTGFAGRITNVGARVPAPCWAAQNARGNAGGKMGSALINGLYVFMLAAFIGFQVIRRVSPLLHTPLMSLTNALDAIAVVGAIVLVGRHESKLAFILGFLAVVAATSNIVGGFLITDRMLKMFKSSRPDSGSA